jgi:2-dehydro-3-deoxyphosphogalactonate aldolase
MPSDPLPAADAVVAILRGVEPRRVVAVSDVLHAAGIRRIEVPLNSPDPFTSIAALAASARPEGSLIGAGTVLDVEAVRRTHAAGGRLIVAPNCDADVIRESLRLAMQVMPGVATATEAFAAIRVGATQLKLFPAVSLGPRHLQALAAVLPSAVRVYAVGGIGAGDLYDWIAAGAAGFGFGSELFRPQYSLEEIDQRARQLLQAYAIARRRIEQQSPPPCDAG